MAVGQAKSVEYYDLLVGHGGDFATKLIDRGISLGADDFAYPINGKLGTSRYSDIVDVRLASAIGGFHLDRFCFIRFASGSHLCVSSRKTRNAAEGQQNRARYRQFVEAFHERLAATQTAAHINFTFGVPPEKIVLMFFICLAMTGAAFFIFGTLPTSSRAGKGIMVLALTPVAIAFLIWSAVSNWPRTYEVTRPPV